MADGESVENQVKNLIQGALDAGGRDNVTVVVVGEKADKASLPPSRREGDTLSTEKAVTEGNSNGHDKMVLGLLGAMVLLALVWMLW